MSAGELEVRGRRLAELEEGIRLDLHAIAERWFAAGQKLAEIRDGRLYQHSHPTFEDYCRDVWGYTSRRANQLIEAAEVRTAVPIDNERQARALAPLRALPEAMEEVWGQVLDEHGESPTGPQVAAAVNRWRDQELRSGLQALGPAPALVPAEDEGTPSPKLSSVERKAWREVRRQLETALRLAEAIDPRLNPYSRAHAADEIRAACEAAGEVLRDLAVAQRRWARETTPDRSG